MGREKAPYRLLFNNDTTCTLTCVSPWHEEGEDFHEDMLVASIQELANTGVDAYILSPGLGWVPWWQSKVLPDHFTWWREMTGLEPQRYEKYVYEGGDMVQVLVDTCKGLDMSPFVSLRLNDVHHQEHNGKRDWRSSVCCRLYTEHPEWHLDPDHREHEGYYGFRGMDWANKEVRDYKLMLLEELAEKYDLAGLELDFLRHSAYFREEMPEAQRMEIMTGFVGEVRAAMDKHRPGDRRMHLSVRIPLDPAKHAELGIDAKRFYDAGVDMFNLSGWYNTLQRTGVAEVRAAAADAAIYHEMTHSAGAHGYFLDSGRYGTNGNPRTTDHQFYTTAELAYERGADGVSLFNFVYYRMGHEMDIPVMEPPFHVLPRLLDKDFLKRQQQEYMLGAGMYCDQMPRTVAAGGTETFQFDIAPHDGPDRSTWKAHAAHRDSPNVCRLRLHALAPISDDAEITATFNGARLEPTGDVSRFFGNPFDLMISPNHSHRRAWIIPKEILRNGLNELAITVNGEQDIKVIYLDAWIA